MIRINPANYFSTFTKLSGRHTFSRATASLNSGAISFSRKEVIIQYSARSCVQIFEDSAEKARKNFENFVLLGRKNFEEADSSHLLRT